MLRTAQELFARHGFDGTPVSQIAAGAGVSKAAVSFHFESKEAILAELVEPLLGELEGVFRPERDRAWPDGVYEIVGDFLDVLIKHHHVAAWVDADRGVHDRHPFGERLLAVHSMLVEVMCGESDVASERVKAAVAAGVLWRPVRTLTSEEIRAYRAEILAAALASHRQVTQPEPTGSV